MAPIKLKSSARELFEDFFFKDRSSDYEVLIITKESKEDWVSWKHRPRKMQTSKTDLKNAHLKNKDLESTGLEMLSVTVVLKKH